MVNSGVTRFEPRDTGGRCFGEDSLFDLIFLYEFDNTTSHNIFAVNGAGDGAMATPEANM